MNESQLSQNNEDDITSKYHQGDVNSQAAFKRKGATERGCERERVKAAVAAARNGITCLDLEQQLGLSHQTCSARVTELRADDKIHVNGSRSQAAMGGKRQSRRHLYFIGRPPAGVEQPRRVRKASTVSTMHELKMLRDIISVIALRIDQTKLTGTSANGLRKWIKEKGYAP